MKKLFLFFTLLAGIAVMTGCKKEQDFVTLKAVIDPDTKAYFGTAVRPYWNADDEVRVMGIGYTTPSDCHLTLSSVDYTCATVLNVPSSPNGYYAAIFPLDAAEKMFVPETTGTAHAVIYYRPDQVYHEVTVNDQTKQQVNMIMGAVTDDNTKTFYFKNLCSILRLNITNNYEKDGVHQGVKVSRVTIQASGAYVAGSADVTLTPNGTPQVVMDGLHEQANNVLSLYPDPEGNVRYIKTLAANGPGSTATIDVVVPPFDASELNIELELYDENDNFLGNSDAIISDPPALALNKIVPIDLTTNHGFEIADYAYLESGPNFNLHMQELLRQITNGAPVVNISFRTVENENNIPHTGQFPAVNVKDVNSPFNIWAYLYTEDNGSTYKILVDCIVPLVYAHKDCSHMFEYLTTLQTMNWNNNSGGSGFQTEDVVNMSYMFAGCSSLTNIAGANFNTTNVRTMAHMFDGCSSCTSFGNLGTTNFNTHNLQDMEAMFRNCAALTSIDLSNFNTNRVSKMKELFSGCAAARSITLSSNFTTPQVTDMSYMFNGCTALESIDLSSFTTAQVTNMENMFNGCENLETLDLRSFNTALVTNMKNLFNDCVKMKTLRLDTFNMSNVSSENKENMVKDMANSATVDARCYVYCPTTVQTSILEQNGTGYYSGLNATNGGNYYTNRSWSDAAGGFVEWTKITFVTPTSK